MSAGSATACIADLEPRDRRRAGRKDNAGIQDAKGIEARA